MERYYIDTEGRRRPERRTEHHLRQVFEHAYELLSPFMEPNNTWGGQSLDRLAFHTVRHHFPQLPSEAVRVLVAACLRRAHLRQKVVATARSQTA